MDPVLRRGGIEQKIKEAARLARIAPEKYRGTAFPILLRHLMGAGGTVDD